MARTHINRWLRRNGIQGQKAIRQASWRHCQHYAQSQTYRHEADLLYEDIGTIPCAMTKQEAFHHTHTVNSVILTLLQPQDCYGLDTQEQYPLVREIAHTSDEPEECNLYKEVLYNHLWEVIQSNEEAREAPEEKSITLQEVVRRLEALEQFTGINDQS